MTSEQNKAIVRRLYEAFEADDEATMNAVLAPDMVANTLGVHGTQNREGHVTRDTHVERGFRNGFHDP